MTYTEIMNYPFINTDKYVVSLNSLLFVLVVILITIFLLSIIKKIIRQYIEKDRIGRASIWSIFQIIKYFIWVIVIMIIMESFGVETSVLLASLAALLVGVGLGIQQLFSDISSGFILLFERNLKINDNIQLEDGTIGMVIDIGLRTSKILTRDNIIMIIPNSKFVNDRIINLNIDDIKTRFHVEVGVAYGSDVKLVTNVLLECVRNISGIVSSPNPSVQFKRFGDSSLEFQLFFWITDAIHCEVIKSEVMYAIDEKFRANNIQIPFPQRDIHIKNN